MTDAIKPGTRVRIKALRDPHLNFLLGKTGTVREAEVESRDYDWGVAFDFDPDGELTSFYQDELEVLS